MCLCEKEETALASHGLVQGNPSEIPQLDGCSWEMPGAGEQASGSPGHSLVDRQLETLHPGTSHPPQGAVSPAKPRETQGTWQLCVCSRGSINAARTPENSQVPVPTRTPAPTNSMLRPEQHNSPPEPWFHPLSSEGHTGGWLKDLRL